jgi:hypothetical protein
VLLVAALAFLLASFPARNSDVWMHLASGRLVAHGNLPFGTDPHLPPDLRTRPAWLYDLACYGLYSLTGGTGLVLAKALLVVGLVLVLLRLSRAGQGWWLPAACTALALLAMSTRLLLQPATVSCLLLALALWFLREPAGGPGPRPSGWLPPWPLLVLFVIWANVDGWFVLGLATVALVGLGRVLDTAGSREGQGGGVPGGLLRWAVGMLTLGAVCLLNPAHVRAYGLPPELGQVLSPFQKAYVATLGLSPAVLAYYPLLALGLLSFVLNLPRWHWGRFLPWLGLALLSAFQVRAVPFFAVVAGPVLAWNLQELFARRLGPGWEQGRGGGRVLTAVAGLLLLVCAWPGWLQAPPFEPRRWGIETSPSLQRGAEAVRRWHREGKLTADARGLYLSPEAAHAFAWFCPEENGVLDGPLAATILGTPGAVADWDRRLRDAGINHVVLYDSDRDRLFTALGRLLAGPEDWPLLYLEGNLAVFGWRDPEAAGAADPFRGWELDPGALAFRPAEDKQAPRQRPDREPAPRPWWEAFWKPAPPPPVDRDEAALHLFHAEALRRSAPRRHLAAWEGGESAGLVAAAAGWAGPGGAVDASLRLVLFRPRVPEAGAGMAGLPALDRRVLKWQETYTLQHDDAPPALLYLAVRAARRALAVDPADARAHLILGESYLRLLHSTRERAWRQRLPELAELRRAQAGEALNRAVALKPDLAQAHLELVGLYHELGYRDLELNHLRTYLKLAHEAGPPPEVSAEEFRDQEARYREELNRLAQEVEDQTNSYQVGSAKLRVLDRALLASQKGLGGKARDLLLGSDVSAFGPEGMALELKLLLQTGRAGDVRDWTGPQQKAALGTSAYHWMRARALAASGDYGLAEEECDQLARSLVAGDNDQAPPQPRETMALLVGQALLEERPGTEPLPSRLWQALRRGQFHERIRALARGLRQEADGTVLRGLLALEQGDVEEAEVAFRVALALWQDDAAAESGAGMDFGGRVIAQGCLEWLEQAETRRQGDTVTR